MILLNVKRSNVYCLLGVPCAGKGTQSYKLQEVLNIACISAGDELRKKYPIGTQERTQLDQGKLVSIDLINQIIEEKLVEHNFNLILDGYPRSASQAQFLQEALNKRDMQLKGVIIMSIHEQEMHKRTLSRKVCITCSRTYPMSVECCGQITTVRRDDTAEVLSNRFNIWNQEKDSILQSLLCPHYIIDANQSIDQVFEDIYQILK